MRSRGPGTSAPKNKILVLDDHPMMRHGLLQLLGNEPDVEIVGEAENARQASAFLSTHKVDLLIADISLPDRSGLELIKDLRALHPELRILVLSMHEEAIYAERVLRAGGRGYIMKQEGGKRILEAIRRVLSGDIYVSEKMNATLLEILSGSRAGNARGELAKLSDREFEVFELVGNGSSTAAIAERLRLSPKTVEVHRANIKQKLGLASGADLVRSAIRWVEAQRTGGGGI